MAVSGNHHHELTRKAQPSAQKRGLMADWYPGAHRVPVGGNGGRITLRPADNVLHIAASNWNVGVKGGVFYPEEQANPSWGIAGWTAGAAACQTYNDEFGNMQQYCSLFESVSGTKDGNYRNRTHEAWNPEGLNGTNAQYNSSKYTRAQVWRFADFLAWDHIENGAVLRDMQNSLASSHGVGAHRYGVDDAGPKSRVLGGETWTSTRGKPCPGTARVEQLAEIIALAIKLVALYKQGKWQWLQPGRVDVARCERIAGGSLAATGNPSYVGQLLHWAA